MNYFVEKAISFISSAKKHMLIIVKNRKFNYNKHNYCLAFLSLWIMVKVLKTGINF